MHTGDNKMIVKFNDLKKLHSPIMCEIQEAILDVIKKSDFINGEALQEFESAWAQYTRKKYCVGVSCGLDALRLSGIALETRCAIVPTNSFIASALAFRDVLFVDIDSESHLIDISPLSDEYINRNYVDTIVPVHLFGQPVTSNVQKFAKENKLKVIEDACQSHGAKGTGWGDVHCYSYYPGKNLGCFGDGGSITTDDKEVADKIRMLANYGSTKKYGHDIMGHNCRLDTIQAAILNVKLPYLDEWNESRRQAAKQYHEELEGVEEIKLLPYNSDSVYHLFVVEAENRDALKKYLDIMGIETGIHYPTPIHKQKAYSEYNEKKYIVAELKATKILSLPMHPFIRSDEISYVCKRIIEFYDGIKWARGKNEI